MGKKEERHIEKERRSGEDRRKKNNLNYKGIERRNNQDRRVKKTIS